MYFVFLPIFSRFPNAFSSIVVSPPAMLPLVGWLSERSFVLNCSMTSLYALQAARNFLPTSGVSPRDAQTCSAPVISDVSPKQLVTPKGSSLSIRLPTVGFDARPEVVSDSPHLTEIQRSRMSHSSRRRSDADWMNSFAFRDAFSIVRRSPLPSIAKPPPGLPVFAMPSTPRPAQPGSMPMTTTAATLGLAPVPISVRKGGSRSQPNWGGPRG